MISAGYRVFLYEDMKSYRENPSDYKIIHEPSLYGEKLILGKNKQSLSEIDSFEFGIYLKHANYSDIEPLKSIIRIVNVNDNDEEFIGRVLQQTGEMGSEGSFSKTFICESLLAFLHDSCQMYSKVANTDVWTFFSEIIAVHNSQVEIYKQFKVGKVTVSSITDSPYRYTGYEDTFDTIKKYLLERLGGYLRLRNEPDGLYVDYLEKVGEEVNSPIRIAKNMKSARREINLDGLITRLVPVGADLETENRDEETGQYTTRERVTISSANNGIPYLEDSELVKEFGIIQNPVEWTEIKTPSILKSRGLQYLRDQKIALSSWTISMVERYLLDPEYKKTIVGNTHPIDNPPLSGAEKLQVVEKTIDILNPQTIEVTIGASSQSLTAFQLQQKEAQKSMEKALYDSNAARLQAEKELTAAQEKLAEAQQELARQINSVENQTSISILKTQLNQYQTLIKAENDNITIITAEIERLRGLEGDNSQELSLATVQLQTSQVRINNYTTIIGEINAKITELGG